MFKRFVTNNMSTSPIRSSAAAAAMMTSNTTKTTTETTTTTSSSSNTGTNNNKNNKTQVVDIGKDKKTGKSCNIEIIDLSQDTDDDDYDIAAAAAIAPIAKKANNDNYNAQKYYNNSVSKESKSTTTNPIIRPKVNNNSNNNIADDRDKDSSCKMSSDDLTNNNKKYDYSSSSRDDIISINSSSASVKVENVNNISTETLKKYMKESATDKMAKENDNENNDNNNNNDNDTTAISSATNNIDNNKSGVSSSSSSLKNNKVDNSTNSNSTIGVSNNNNNNAKIVSDCDITEKSDNVSVRSERSELLLEDSANTIKCNTAISNKESSTGGSSSSSTLSSKIITVVETTPIPTTTDNKSKKDLSSVDKFMVTGSSTTVISYNRTTTTTTTTSPSSTLISSSPKSQTSSIIVGGTDVVVKDALMKDLQKVDKTDNKNIHDNNNNNNDNDKDDAKKVDPSVADETSAGEEKSHSTLPAKFCPEEEGSEDQMDIEDDNSTTDKEGCDHNLPSKSSNSTSVELKTSDSKEDAIEDMEEKIPSIPQNSSTGSGSNQDDDNQDDDNQDDDDSSPEDSFSENEYVKGVRVSKVRRHAIPVVAIDVKTGKIRGHYRSLRKAAEKTGTDHHAIRAMVRGKVESCKGITFREDKSDYFNKNRMNKKKRNISSTTSNESTTNESTTKRMQENVSDFDDKSSSYNKGKSSESTTTKGKGHNCTKAIPLVAYDAKTKEIIGYFQSLRKAAENANCNIGIIRLVLNGELDSWNGIVWKKDDTYRCDDDENNENEEDGSEQVDMISKKDNSSVRLGHGGSVATDRGRRVIRKQVEMPKSSVVMVSDDQTDEVSSVLTQFTEATVEDTDKFDDRLSTTNSKKKRKYDDTTPLIAMKKGNYNSTNDNEHLGKKETGWWHGNGIDRDRIQLFANADLTFCSSCQGCQNDKCGKCGLCQFGKGVLYGQACVLKCCEKNSIVVKKLFTDEIEFMRSRPLRCLRPGTRVYSRWPQNDYYYWGEIQRRYSVSGARGMYLSINFDDGDHVRRVSEQDVRDELEVMLEQEEMRLVDGINMDSDPVEMDTGCGDCFNCTKEECKQCAVCRHDNIVADYLSGHATCLQKMCCKTSNRVPFKNAYPAPGLPNDLRFLFVNPISNTNIKTVEYRGLRLISSNNRTYNKLETTQKEFSDEDREAFYNFVGLPHILNLSYKSHHDFSMEAQWSEEKGVGARCYARFTNGEFYWGKIVKVTRLGNNTKFDVAFDDGDFLHNIECRHVYTEKEAKSKFSDFRDEGDPRTLSLIELFQRRCGFCKMCQKQDCGKCKACKDNMCSTSPHRRVCLLKMCSRIPVDFKAQAVVELPKGWKFYFAEEDCKEESICYADKSIRGLRFISQGNRVYDCPRKLTKSFNYNEDLSYTTIATFLGKELGVKLRLKKKHELVGKGFFRAWSDVSGRRREVYGEIVRCDSVLTVDGFDLLLFTVRYEECRNDLKAFPTPTGLELSVPLLDENVESKDAWGGYFAFLEITGKSPYSVSPGSQPKLHDHFKWIVPDYRLKKTIFRESIHLMILRHQGFELTFQAKTSGIPNAGLGLWVSCLPLSSKVGNEYILPAGHKIDLGVYAPLLGTDRKTEFLSLVKLFLYDWEGEMWSFDTHQREDMQSDVFDITSNMTGDLHDEARNNIVIYANETDGQEEIPTIHAHHDPEGSVHYLMGHTEERGPFKLLANGVQIELKVDYGEFYEKVRVRKGYPRVQGHELDKLRSTVEEEDRDFVQELQHYSADALHESLALIEYILEKNPNPSQGFLQRALLATVAMYARYRSILFEFKKYPFRDVDSICNNGYSDMEERELSDRLKDVIKCICNILYERDDLKHAILSMDLLGEVISESLGKGCDYESLKNMDETLLLKKLGEM